MTRINMSAWTGSRRGLHRAWAFETVPWWYAQHEWRSFQAVEMQMCASTLMRCRAQTAYTNAAIANLFPVWGEDDEHARGTE